ncbi:MAG: hypothetical protein M1334_03845, partial [Patescibacteria group bacterium]|nr:hypothetical protein [Patescibacteria group bacterium]
MKKIQVIIIAIVVALVFGVAGYFIGSTYGNKSNLSGGQAYQSQNGQRVIFRGGANSGVASGQIVSFDDKSITVKSSNGGSAVIFYSTSTEISKMATSSVSDLANNENITVIGSQNSDG